MGKDGAVVLSDVLKKICSALNCTVGLEDTCDMLFCATEYGSVPRIRTGIFTIGFKGDNINIIWRFDNDAQKENCSVLHSVSMQDFT